MDERHELPTHLGVEDRVLGDLTMRQLLLLLGGAATAYAAWQALPALAPGPRAALVAAALLGALALALIRPGDRGLGAWGVAVLRYAARPKTAVWRQRQMLVEHAPVGIADWFPYLPQLAWGGADGPSPVTADLLASAEDHAAPTDGTGARA